MDQPRASSILTAENRGFPDLARRLFGSVTLDFGGETMARHVTSTVLGACRYSELRAGAHTVRGDHVVARSDDPDSIKLLLQTRGRSYICQGGQRLPIGSGNAIVYDPVRPYTLFHPEPVYLHIVQLPRDVLQGRLANSLAVPLRMRFARDTAGQTLVNGVKSLLSERLSSGTSPDPLAAALALLAEARIQAHWPLATLRLRALSAIESRLHDPDLDVGRLARILGCSTRYLHQCFAEVGQTPSDCLWQRRLDLAYRCLVDTSDQRSISDVAFALGFSSSAHFSRLFRQRYDRTPRQLRLSASLQRPETCQ